MTSEEWFEKAANAVIATGNRLSIAAGNRPDGADQRIAADGMLAGAISFWLLSRKPCGRGECVPCTRLDTPQKRMAELARLLGEFAPMSDHYRTANDAEDAEVPATVQ